LRILKLLCVIFMSACSECYSHVDSIWILDDGNLGYMGMQLVLNKDKSFCIFIQSDVLSKGADYSEKKYHTICGTYLLDEQILSLNFTNNSHGLSDKWLIIDTYIINPILNESEDEDRFGKGVVLYKINNVDRLIDIERELGYKILTIPKNSRLIGKEVGP